jgi:hypothetical protein
MRDIYEHAFRVLVCLSTSEIIDYYIARLLDGLAKALKNMPEKRNAWSNVWYGKLDKVFKSVHSGEVQSFYALIFSRWWRRAWVCQEFIAAKDATFLYSGSSIHWTILELAVFYLGYLHPHSIDRQALRAANYMLTLKTYWDNASDIKDILAYAHVVDASDPRDKIFAFLGLAKHNLTIIPDYSAANTALNLYVQLSINIITTENQLTLLKLVASTPFRSPSWALNMQLQPNMNVLLRPRTYSKKSLPKTDGPVAKFVLNDEEFGPKMLVRGVRLSSALFLFEKDRPQLKVRTGCMIDPDDPGLRVPLCGQDELWFLNGACLPFVLRPIGNHFVLIGESRYTEFGDRDPLGRHRRLYDFNREHQSEKTVLKAIQEGKMSWVEISLI